jgi:hypothetical protein
MTDNSYPTKAAIRELQSAYCFRMDDADFAGVAALFTKDGRWITSYEQARGRGEIEAVLTRVNPEKGVGPVRKHLLLNGLIDVDGETASARTSYLVLGEGDAGPTPIVVGTYEDRLALEDGRWLLAERHLVHEIAGDLKLRL